jgi:hypothetical protein
LASQKNILQLILTIQSVKKIVFIPMAAAATMMTVVPDVNINNEEGGDVEDPTTPTKTKAKVGCCTYTKDFLLYNSSTPLNQAFYLNQFGRAMLFITFMFLSLGVLQLANKQANCPTVTDTKNGNISYTNCGNKVYGMLPSSILSLMAIIGGVATSCFMPYAGAVSSTTTTTLYEKIVYVCLCDRVELFEYLEFVRLK